MRWAKEDWVTALDAAKIEWKIAISDNEEDNATDNQEGWMSASRIHMWDRVIDKIEDALTQWEWPYMEDPIEKAAPTEEGGP